MFAQETHAVCQSPLSPFLTHVCVCMTTEMERKGWRERKRDRNRETEKRERERETFGCRDGYPVFRYYDHVTTHSVARVTR